MGNFSVVAFIISYPKEDIISVVLKIFQTYFESYLTSWKIINNISNKCLEDMNNNAWFIHVLLSPYLFSRLLCHLKYQNLVVLKLNTYWKIIDSESINGTSDKKKVHFCKSNTNQKYNAEFIIVRERYEVRQFLPFFNFPHFNSKSTTTFVNNHLSRNYCQILKKLCRLVCAL